MSTCKICSQDLVVELDPESFDEASSAAVGDSTTAPDDLLLQCGCHFHFQCLLDESSEISLSLVCPACGDPISSAPEGSSLSPRVVTQYRNEGGFQPSLDIHPLIVEEAFLTANPSARPARAFMTLCAEGDVPGVLELLQAITEDPDETDLKPGELVRWQDPLDGGKSALHIAVEKEKVEVLWILLWLASALDEARFPMEMRQAMGTLGISRDVLRDDDIRGLKDEQERTAEDVAKEIGGAQSGLILSGLLAIQ